MIRVVQPGSCFLPIPDPGVKKALDPGSAILRENISAIDISSWIMYFHICRTARFEKFPPFLRWQILSRTNECALLVRLAFKNDDGAWEAAT